MEENGEEYANIVEQAFDLKYNVDQTFYSNIVLKSVLLFMGGALNDGMDFEPEDGEGDNDVNNKGGDDEGGGMG